MLIIGCTGTIGLAMLEAAKSTSADQVHFTSRTSGADPESIHLDLTDISTFANLRGKVGTAFICAAQTSMQACMEEKARTRQANVEGTLELARQLTSNGNHVVYYSTNLVFDGTNPRTEKHHPPHPRTSYGRQKVEIEKALLEMGEAIAIVRLTKVVHSELPLFVEWERRLRQGKSINAFTNWNFSPIHLKDVCKYSMDLARTKGRGLYQLSSETDLSYADAAAMLAKSGNFPLHLVRGIRVEDSPFSPEWIPKHTTLKSEYNLPDAKQCLKEVFRLLHTSHALNQSHG